jgi:hypothetical protein
MWMNHDTDVAFHVVENRSAREIGQGMCLPAITPQGSGRRCRGRAGGVATHAGLPPDEEAHDLDPT